MQTLIIRIYIGSLTGAGCRTITTVRSVPAATASVNLYKESL